MTTGAVVDAGATRGLVGSETYVAYKKSALASAPGREFRESDTGVKFRVANGQIAPAAFEASVPLTLTDVNAKAIPARSTWSVIFERRCTFPPESPVDGAVEYGAGRR